MFNQLVDQEKVWSQLVAAYKNNRVPSAYLFHGSSGTGKEGFAIKFAALINCKSPGIEPCGSCSSCKKFETLQHPNLTFIVPFPRDRNITKNDPAVKALSDRTLKEMGNLIREKAKNPYHKISLPGANTILLNSIRDLRKSIYLSATETGRKMILILDAHKLMTRQGESANALLKILEEPPKDTTFILVTDFPDQLAETILSRCQKIYFPSLSEYVVENYLISQYDKTKSVARIISHLSQGDIRTAQNLAREDLREVEQLVKMLVQWISHETEEGWRNFLGHGTVVYRSNPQEFFDHLKLLSCWFRDALHIQKLNNQAQLILESMDKDIQDFVDEFPTANFSNIILALETCSDSLSRNFNLNLVLMNLILDIQEHLSRIR